MDDWAFDGVHYFEGFDIAFYHLHFFLCRTLYHYITLALSILQKVKVAFVMKNSISTGRQIGGHKAWYWFVSLCVLYCQFVCRDWGFLERKTGGWLKGSSCGVLLCTAGHFVLTLVLLRGSMKHLSTHSCVTVSCHLFMASCVTEQLLPSFTPLKMPP